MSETHENSCEIFGVAGMFVQIVLGVLSFSVLVLKRYKQRPKRPWKIWSLDSSKQAVSQLIAHFINIAISLSLSKKLQNNACIWYFATNLFDNTVGVLFTVTALRFLQRFILSRGCQGFKSGNYYEVVDQYDQDKASQVSSVETGSQHSDHMRTLQISIVKKKYIISHFNWFIQFLIWNIIVAVSKTILFFLELLLNKPLEAISQFLLGWIQPYPIWELIIVIIIIPVCMNALAFWIQDNFLKKQETQETVLKEQLM